jgi:hypothetical protein
MEPTDFNFRETVSAVWQAASAVTCHILFDAAVHGLFVSAVILTVSLVLRTRKHRFARPLAFVARNIAILCVVFTIPGFVSLAFTGKFPYTGVYNINSLGFLGFWGMVTVHLCFEEMNFQWFTKGPPPEELGAVEGFPTSEGSDNQAKATAASQPAETGTMDFTPPAEPKDGADRPEEHLEASQKSK